MIGAKALFAVLFAALMLAGVQAPAAYADDDVAVTVNVTTKAGTPLPGLAVYAYPVEDHAVAREGVTGVFLGGKSYSFTLDDETQYAFYFDAPPNATTAFDQFLGGTTFVEEADYWSYVTGQTTLDVTLATNSTITGKVTGASSALLSGVSVYPWRFDGNGWFRLDEAVAKTTSAGVYTMRNLEPGTYRLEFAPSNLTGYLSEFSGNTTVFANAAAVNVGLGTAVTSNAALALGGTISGTVKLKDCTIGTPPNCNVVPNGITAYAFRLNPDNTLNTELPPFASRQTTTTGAWSIPGLPSGRYKVKLRDTLDPDFPVFVDKWTQNADSSSAARIYTITGTSKIVESVAATMPFYQETADTSLVLTVKDHTGAAIGDDAEVYIVPQGSTDQTQHFLLVGGTTYFPFMAPGTYDVYVDPPTGADAPFVGTQSIGIGANTWNITLAAPSSFQFTTPPSIANSATAVGSTYVVDPGQTSFDDDDVQYSYIWLRGDTPIFGSQSTTSSSYTSRGVDYGSTVRVIVRADTFGYAPVFSTVVAAAPVTIGSAPLSDAGDPPTVAGPVSPVPGSVLTARVGAWNVPGLRFSYQWYSGGSPVGTDARTYLVQPSDAGRIITFAVSAHREGYLPGGAVAANTVTAGFLPAPKPTKSSTFAVTAIPGGIKATATPGTWSPAPGGLTYDWKIGGVSYPDAGPVFSCSVAGTPSCQSTGLAIELTVTAHRTGYLDASKSYIVRKGTLAPSVDQIGFVYDVSDGGHPSFDDPGDPAFVGHTLTATPPEYAYPGGSGGTLKRSYQWQRKTGTTWANISGKTGTSYVVGTADVNHELRVRVTTTSTLYPTVTELITAGTGALRLDLTASHPNIGIGGTENTGTVKTAMLTGSWPTSGVTVKYQWYLCDPDLATCSDTATANPGWKAISAATATSYRPLAAQNGRQLLVQIVGSKSGYRAAVLRSAPLVLDDSTPAVGYAGPSSTQITGGIIGSQAAVGRTLTVKPGTLDRTTGVTQAVEWQVCDGASGTCETAPATGSTLTAAPTAAWTASFGANTHVRVMHHVSIPGGSDFDGPSPRYPLAPGTNVPSVKPFITSAPGSAPGLIAYTLHPGTWTDTAFDIEWYDGADVVGTAATLERSAGTTPIVVILQASRTGYQPAQSTLVARKGTLPAQPGITGARYGDTLSVGSTVPAWTAGMSKRYQWYSGTTAITGKTGSSFVPSTAYIGKALKVRVTVSSPYWNTVSYYTPPVKLGSHLAAAGTPVVVSSLPGASPGAKLSADRTSFPSGMTYTYAWERSTDGGTSWTKISTASSYVTTVADIGKQVRVKVVAKRTGWTTSAAIASAPVTVNYSPALALSAPFALTGSGRVDGALTASTAWNTTGVALAYTWTRNGVTIPGATSSTITPTASWFGDEVQAHVTATKAGHLPVTVHSNEVKIVEAAAPTPPATLAVTTSSAGLTVAPGVWSVAGLVFEITWVDVAAPSTVLCTSSTFAPPAAGSYRVTVTSVRDGYLPASVSRVVTVV